VPSTPAVLLKDIEVPNVPSPYYHFEYDAQNRISVASFASGFFVYNVTYDAGNIKEMANDAVGNRDKLTYSYDKSGRVDTVRYLDRDGAPFVTVGLSYNGRQLVTLERRRKIDSEFVLDKVMSFSYYPDGNLMEIVERHPAIEGRQAETTTHDRFEHYDDKINVDAFGLIHDEFFDHLVLLPGVTLQKGNAAKEIVTGDGLNYTVDYTYTYDDARRPLTKSWTLVFTTGDDAGKPFSATSRFSYY
jgi:hypothetical protein